MMPASKRSWDDANLYTETAAGGAGSWAGFTRPRAPTSSGDSTANGALSDPSLAQSWALANISRRIKACGTCRRHKIKCLMEESGPPCKRCAEKNLSCTLNKSLQTLITEKTQLSDAILHDIETLRTVLQAVTKSLQLPPVPILQSLQFSTQSLQEPAPDEPFAAAQPHDETGPSCDASPRLAPEDDTTLPQVPIQSVYRLTKLSALRSPQANDPGHGASHPHPSGDAIDDFISRGLLAHGDAERLYGLYSDHLDHFMYGIGGRYKSLDSARRTSRILTACILTVAALHDASPQSAACYGTCMNEFRRLMAASFFNRRVDRDYLRAMCIASYWLSEISWTVSGYAIRRAAESNISESYRRATESEVNAPDEEAVDQIRLWYVLYICDQHLSTLYGRQPILRDDIAVKGWESFGRSPGTNDEDRRLVSQVALLNIMNNIRELFGTEATEPIPDIYSRQIASFARQLDKWLATWSSVLTENHASIGGFPRKGVLLHYHFAMLHLHAHVFRGRHDASGIAIPAQLAPLAMSAVASATAILESLVADPEMHLALAGMPSYMHSMTAFACVFLAKLAMLPDSASTPRGYDEHATAASEAEQFVDRGVVLGMIERLIALYRSTSVGKWHLVNLMAHGLEKMLETMKVRMERQAPALDVGGIPPLATEVGGAHEQAGFGHGQDGLSGGGFFNFDPNSFMDSSLNNLATSPFLYMDSGLAVFDSTDLSPTSFLG